MQELQQGILMWYFWQCLDSLPIGGTGGGVLAAGGETGATPADSSSKLGSAILLSCNSVEAMAGAPTASWGWSDI
jgi:hypothetical protein